MKKLGILGLTVCGFVSLLFTGSISSVAYELNPQQIEALEEFGGQFQAGMGVVLTPPIGNVDPEVLEAKAYLEELVEVLAGEELADKDTKLVVNLYSTNNINAFAHEIIGHQGVEKQWIEKQGGPWPVRSLYQAGPNQTILELGFSVGLLSKLKTRAQLAFIVAHELIHFLERHTHHDVEDLKRRFEKMWASQSDEAVADSLGIRLMIGKFELSAAIEVLRMLAADNTDLSSEATDVFDAAEAGASSHHSTGVRISMAEFFIELLRRTDERAIPLADESLPDVFKRLSQRNPRDGIPLKAFEDKWPLLQRAIHDLWMQDKVYRPISREDWHYKKSDYLREVFSSQEFKAHRESILMRAIEEIDQIKAVSEGNLKARKVNTFLQLLAVLASYDGYGGLGRFFKSAQDLEDGDEEVKKTIASPFLLNRIRRFLAENSVGEGAWAFSDLQRLDAHFKSIDRAVNNGLNLTERMMLTGSLAEISFDLARLRIPAWENYVNRALNPESYFQEDEIDFEKISSTLTELNAMGSNPIALAYQDQWIEQLSNLTIDQVLKTRLTTTAFGLLANTFMPRTMPNGKSYNVDVSDFVKRIQQTIGPLTEKFNKARYSEIMKASQNLANREAGSPLRYVMDLYGDFKIDNFSETEIQALDLQMSQLVLDMSEDIEAMMPGEGTEIYLGPNAAAWFARTLSGDFLSKEQKLTYIKTLSSLLGSMGAFVFGDKTEHSDSSDEVREFLFALTPDELMQLLTAQTTLITEQFQPWIDGAEVYFPNTFAKEFGQLRNPQYGEDFLEWAKARGWEYDRYKGNQLGELLWGTSLNTLKLYAEVGAEKLPINAEQFKQLLDHLRSEESAAQRLTTLYGGVIMTSLMKERDMVLLLVATAFDHLEVEDNFEEFYYYLKILSQFADNKMHSAMSWQQKQKLSGQISDYLLTLRSTQQARWLDKKLISDSLLAEDLVEVVFSILSTSISRDSSIEHIAEQTSHFLKRFDLKDSRPEAYALLQSRISEHFQIQPRELDLVFPEDQRSVTEQANEHSGNIRGLSALIHIARDQSPSEQLELIEFLMGRSQETPSMINNLRKWRRPLDTDERQQVINLLVTVRSRIENQSDAKRAFVVNSILTGDNS
ncbi:MAG: hypothetical protein AAF202_02050, partial [Pseudomonadota bacterium]